MGRYQPFTILQAIAYGVPPPGFHADPVARLSPLLLLGPPIVLGVY
jgi:hypothetical protein